ncbi:MAG: crossover junction endodeoxyribonuclease RuvC [Candidatus Bipolaricaulaceae bacterium]
MTAGSTGRTPARCGVGARVLGVDPGLVATGYGVLEQGAAGPRALAQGTIRPPRGAALPDRLQAIHAELVRVVASYDPQVVAVEEVFLARNAPAAMLTAQVLGVVKLAATGRTLRSYAPREVKKWICGTGSARKEQMMRMMAHLLRGGPAGSDHAADALAVALCALLDGGP